MRRSTPGTALVADAFALSGVLHGSMRSSGAPILPPSAGTPRLWKRTFDAIMDKPWFMIPRALADAHAQVKDRVEALIARERPDAICSSFPEAYAALLQKAA